MLMLFHKYLYSSLSLIEYLPYRAIFSLLTAFGINLCIGPYFIKYMKKCKITK